MHITQKGQVTIPQYIRKKFGFLPDTEVDFVVENHQVVLKKAKKKTVQQQIKSLRGSMKGRHSAKLLMQLSRGEDFE